MIDRQLPHMVNDLQCVMNGSFGVVGQSGTPLSGGFNYPPQKVEHPLKGLLKDKGCEDAIAHTTQLYEHYCTVARHLYKMVQERNEAAGGGYLFLSHYTYVQFRWRSTRALDRLTGFTNRANRIAVFSRSYPHYDEVSAILKEQDPELYQFYRAVDTVRSDVALRLRISYALMQEYIRAQDETLNFEERLNLSTAREVTAVLTDLNHRIEASK